MEPAAAAVVDVAVAAAVDAEAGVAVAVEKLPQPKRFKIQWHITDCCNLHCVHCYQHQPAGHPSLHQLLDMYQHIYAFFHRLRTTQSHPIPLHLSITGGEPLLFPQFFALIETVARQHRLYSFSLLSNGTLITKEWATRLRHFKPAFVQISLEGGLITHERIRGIGTYQQALKGIRHLRRAGIPVVLSMTIHKNNWQEFPQVVQVARKLGVRLVWADRLLPEGQAHINHLEPISASELQAFHRLMYTQKIRLERRRLFTKTRVSMGRALQFMEGGGKPYRCVAGEQLLTILPDGMVVPCRRMPEPLANLAETSLEELYSSHPFLSQLRNSNALPWECGDCHYKLACRGGLRCLSYALYHNPFMRDPDCPLPQRRR